MEQFDPRLNIDWKDDYIQVVSGGILGDGSMGLAHRARTPTYRETHGYRQRDYVLWKCRMLGSSMRDYTTFDGRTGKFYVSSTLWVTDSRNVGLYKSFYFNGKKAITAATLSDVNDLGLAVLWLDDGSTKLHDGNGKLSLQSFSQGENRSIMAWLQKRYDINSVLTSENEIFFNSREMPKLLSVVYPIYKSYQLPDCMRYKMGSADSKNVELIEGAKERRRARDRDNYRRIMIDPVRKAKLHRTAKETHERRMSDPEYKQRYNEYHKEWERNKRSERRE